MLTFDEKTLAKSRHDDELANCVHYVCWIGATSGCGVGTFASVNISGRLWLYICELGVRHTKLLFSQTFLGLCEQSHVQGLLRQQNPSMHLPPLVWGWTALAADWTVYSRPPSRQHCCAAPPVGLWSAPRPDRIYIFPGKSGAYPGVLSPVGRAQNTSKIR